METRRLVNSLWMMLLAALIVAGFAEQGLWLFGAGVGGALFTMAFKYLFAFTEPERQQPTDTQAAEPDPNAVQGLDVYVLVEWPVRSVEEVPTTAELLDLTDEFMFAHDCNVPAAIYAVSKHSGDVMAGTFPADESCMTLYDLLKDIERVVEEAAFT